MNFGFVPTTQGWKEERKKQLAEELTALCKEFGGGDEEFRFSGNPYVEVDRLYPGVRIRKITNLTDEQHKEIVAKAEAIYQKVMIGDANVTIQ